MRYAASLALFALCPLALSAATIEKGTFRFTPPTSQSEVPARYQLKAASFSYELQRKKTLPGLKVTVSNLKFPSPVKSPVAENNTVHAEYYCPNGKGPFPCVIVLGILDGNQIVPRQMAAYLAGEGVAALFVHMAYYGPRRPTDKKVRLLSTNLPRTVAAITQTVLDLRVAAAWMASRSELDKKRLGIMGTSLGSFFAALAGQMEPRLGRVGVLLGGGGFIDGYYDHPQAAPYRKTYEALGGKKSYLKSLVAPLDPLTKAANLKERKLLILAAENDNVVPPSMAKALWEASGKQPIVWYDANHYTAALYVADALERLTKHFKK